MSNSNATSTRLDERRRQRDLDRQAQTLAASVEAREKRGLTFDHIHRVTPTASGPGRKKLTEGLSDADQQSLWDDLDQQIKDRRFRDGEDAFRAAKKPVKNKAIATTVTRRTNIGRDAIEEAVETFRSLSVPDYFPAIAGVEALPGGRCRCPLPDHEDVNPSASWRGGLWYCHRDGVGGDLVSLASEISGIPDKGPEFLELARWIADRLLIHADEVRDALDRRAA